MNSTTQPKAKVTNPKNKQNPETQTHQKPKELPHEPPNEKRQASRNQNHAHAKTEENKINHQLKSSQYTQPPSPRKSSKNHHSSLVILPQTPSPTFDWRRANRLVGGVAPSICLVCGGGAVFVFFSAFSTGFSDAPNTVLFVAPISFSCFWIAL